MQKILIAVYSGMLFILCACERGSTIAEMRQETYRMLMGRWQLEKKRMENFDHYPTLISETVYVGTTEDFFHFKDNDSISIGEAGKLVIEEPVYINVKQVVIFPLLLSWSIDSLRDNRLILSRHFSKDDDSVFISHRETLYFKK